MSTKKQKENSEAAEDIKSEEIKDEQTTTTNEQAPETIEPELEITEVSESTESELEELQKKIEDLEKKSQSLQNDYLRLMAEFDNYRKRTLKEKADLLKNGGEDAIQKLLPVIDDFERALDALEKSDDITAVKEGIELIYSKFKSYLDNNGVKEIPSVGESFDTEVHEAITTFPAPTPEQKGQRIECMTQRTKLNDKVLRCSTGVIVEY